MALPQKLKSIWRPANPNLKRELLLLKRKSKRLRRSSRIPTSPAGTLCAIVIEYQDGTLLRELVNVKSRARKIQLSAFQELAGILGKGLKESREMYKDLMTSVALRERGALAKIYSASARVNPENMSI